MLLPCSLGAFVEEARLEVLSMTNPASHGNEQETAHILVVQLRKHQGSEGMSTNNNWTEKNNVLV